MDVSVGIGGSFDIEADDGFAWLIGGFIGPEDRLAILRPGVGLFELGNPTVVWCRDETFFGRAEPSQGILVPAMRLWERITVESGQCGGRPCIRGYRLRVSDVLALIAAGANNEEILEDYPFPEPDDSVAALTYVARQADHTVILGAA